MCLLIYQQTSAHQNTVHLCERNLNRHCEVLDEKYRIAVQGIFVGIMIKASGASLEVTDLLFAFDFCKK